MSQTYTPKRALPTSAIQQNHRHGTPGNSVSSRKKEAARNKKLGISKPAAFNIKANTQNNYMAKWKYVKKLMDREHRKHHALTNKRVTAEMTEPPVFVAVVGPPGVGKSLLIRSLIKHYTTTKITDCRGPMTILANSTRRITFLECPNDLNAMIDVAKTCDLALLLVDASYGFEMETFEFLNCAQIHGFPRVMGVLTHLDKYVKLKKKQSIVYHVKHRFWKEIYSGAKLFVLKGIDQKTDYYYRSDIQNLVRFISVLKFRPLTWRNSHSYILCDRFEDLTPPALIHKHGAKHTERRIAFYGYVRGCNMRQKSSVHICGVGDYEIESIEEMEDPVPTKKSQKKSSTLRVLTKNGKVYAPMANLGPVVFDKHAAYITVRNDAKSAKRDDLQKHSWETEEAYVGRLKREAMATDESKRLIDIKSGDGQSIMTKLRDKYKGIGIDEKIKKSELRLFAGSKALSAADIDSYEMEKNLAEIEKVSEGINVEVTKKNDRIRRRVRFDDEIKVNEQNGKIELNEDAMDWTNDSENENGVISKENVWNESWLNTKREKERKQKENEKQRNKIQKAQKLNRSLSTSISESNSRWKQNLLSNASEIWHRTVTLSEHIYGQSHETTKNQNETNNANGSDSDDDFFKIKQPRTMQFSQIDTIDSAVCALKKFDLSKDIDTNNNEKEDKWWNMSDEIVKESIRNRFVTGDWVEAQKFASEVERRAHDVNPDLYDEEITKDREILESLGAKTMDNADNEFNEETLDWEFKLEQLMKTKGIDGDISMEDKLAFAQNGVFSKDDILQNKDDEKKENETETTINRDLSTMDLEDLNRLEAKIKKKQQFDREFDSGLLEFDAAFDQTGMSKDEQDKIFEKKGDLGRDKEKERKRDRSGKLRGRGGLEFDDRKNLPGAGKGVYYMDIVREQMAKQNELNREEFEQETEAQQQKLRGFVPGCYVQIIIKALPSEFDLNFDLEYPLIIGCLLPQELQFGLIQVRIKKHRWYKRLLKFNDPLIISCGWRRYQSCPLYCMEDRNSSISNKRLRLIKYTPDYMHCLAVFYGPIVPPNTGFLGYISSSSQICGFRIAATGNILSCNQSYKIVKKLKLVGEPMEIHKNTVFVKGMFNTNVEVSKFIGAKIQTVSGIRGSIKKSEGKKGNFRATFEDKLLKSDIIFLKSWVPIQPYLFYYNVRNLLLADKESWSGMKTVGQIKFEQKKSAPFKRDSVYNKEDDIERNPLRKFNKLTVPKKLEKSLPFRLRPKYDRDLRSKKEKHLEAQNYATKNEKKAQQFISKLSLIAANHNERQTEMKRKQRSRKRAFKKSKLHEERLKKRQRIAKKMSGDKGDDVGLQFEATRGNKFHKEWRLAKK